MFTDVSVETIALEDVVFEDVDSSALELEQFLEIDTHFRNMADELGMSTVWSITDGGALAKDAAIFRPGLRLVRYQFVRNDATSEEIYADLEDGGNRSMAEVTSFAVSGTVQDLWRAAESCIRQSGTHHIFIEEFEMQEDGTLVLVTGS